MTRLLRHARAELGATGLAIEILGFALALAIVGMVLAGLAVVL